MDVGVGVLTADWRSTPLWWDEAPPLPAAAEPPSRADVVVVGGGYCGLSCARTLARAGVRVVVLDADDPGAGAATRNHGHVGGIGKLPAGVERVVGAERAARMKEDMVRARHFLLDLIADEKLDVDYVQCGRFMGAHSPAAYEAFARNADAYRLELGLTIHMVPQAEQRAETGSDFYFGGMIAEEAGALQPAKLHRELRRLAEAAGATICGGARVATVLRGPHGFDLATSRGSLRADNVVLATNAYTDAVSPYVRRRIVPVAATMIATEPLPEPVARQIMPTNRTGGDTKRALYAFRRSPDGRRIVFAGRARFGPIDEADAAPVLHRFMRGVWPQLAEAKISHCWKGYVGFTYDRVQHMGQVDGVHYVAGCNGSGVMMMTYLGHQTGLKLLGTQDRPCGFDGDPFAPVPVPFYRGDPWFLPAVGGYYVARDRLDRLMGGR